MNKLLSVGLLLFLCVACTTLNGQEIPNENIEKTKQSRIDKAIQKLHLKILKETADLDVALYKVSPNNSEETVVIIPEIINEEEDAYELNTNIFIVNNASGQVTHTFFESSKTNGWTSDAIFIDNIAIDTTAYKLTPTKNAFGIIVTWRSMSQPNPYWQESISLYTKEKDSLTKVLDLYTISESSGEVNVNACYAKFNKAASKLSVSDSITGNYFDILVDKTTSEEVFEENENGECSPKEKIIAREKKVLKFDNKTYSEKELISKNLQIKRASVDSKS